MTVESTDNRAEYTGNGSTTEFSFPYLFLSESDLVVLLDGTEQTLNSDYTVTGAEDPNGGAVEFTTAPADGADVIIFRDPEILQPFDLVENDSLPAEEAERAWDRITLVAQRLRELVSRSFRLSDAVESGVDVQVPAPEASTLIGWNVDGDALTNREVQSLDGVMVGTAPDEVPTNADLRVDTLADLQALDTSGARSVYMIERTAGNGGGEGHFRWDSSDLSTEVGNDEVTAGEGDGGIYVAPASDKTGASGAWVRQFTGAVAVLWYGASGDGATDDSPSVIAALNYLVNAGGGTLRFDGGTYLIGSSISRESFSNVRFEGTSWMSEMKFLQATGAVFGDVSHLSFHNMAFTSEQVAGTLGIAFSFNKFDDVSFDNCLFYGFGDPQAGVAGGEMLQFHARESDGVTGAVAGSSRGAVVTNCVFDGGNRDCEFAIRFHTDYTLQDGNYTYQYELRDCHVAQCRFEGFNWNAVEFCGPTMSGGTLVGCSFYNCGITGPEVDKGAHDIVISDCTVDGLFGDYSGNVARGISVQGWDNGSGVILQSYNVIVSNVVVNNIQTESKGIYLSWVKDISIVDCKVDAGALVNFSRGVEVGEEVENVDIRDLSISNFCFGIIEIVPRISNITLGRFRNVRFETTLKGPVVSFYEGDARAPASGFQIRAELDGIFGLSDLSDSSIYTADSTNPALVQTRDSGGASSEVILINSEIQGVSAPAGAGFVRLSSYEGVFKNNRVFGVDEFFPTSHSPTVQRLIVSNMPNPISDLSAIDSRVPSSCYIYPEYSGSSVGEFVSSAVPANASYLTGMTARNLSPSAGGKWGWVCVAGGSPGTWKAFGAIDT